MTPPKETCCTLLVPALLLAAAAVATGQLAQQVDNHNVKLYEAFKPYKQAASWRKMELALAKQISSFLASNSTTSFKSQLESAAASLAATKHLSQDCSMALNETLGALISDEPKRQKLWAAAMLDASAKLPAAGLLSGSLAELGNFDQCLALQQGQYCNVQVKPPLERAKQPLCQVFQSVGSLQQQQDESAWQYLAKRQQVFQYSGLRLGLCLPRRCNQDELQRLLRILLDQFDLSVKIKSCQHLPTPVAVDIAGKPVGNADQNYFHLLGLRLDTVQLAILVCMLTLVGQCFVCTLIDLMRAPNPNELVVGNSNGCGLTATDSRRGQPKRWHYDVYQEVCDRQLTGAELFGHFHRMSLQRNPLVAATRDQQDSSNASGLDLEAEESWLEQLEQAEAAELDPASRRRRKPSSAAEATTGGCTCLPPGSLLSCFSLAKNSSNLFGLDKPTSRIPILNGIRTLSMIWIIFGHTFGLVNLDMLS